MKLYSIGLTDRIEEFRQKLHQDCQPLAQEGFQISIDEEAKGGFVFLHCQVVEGELSFRNYERIKGRLKYFIARLIADQIMKREEERLIRKIIDQSYEELSVEERLQVSRRVRSILDNYGDAPTYFTTVMRRRIIGRVLDYLDTAHEITVQGFLNFRLKDYQQLLRDAVNTAAEDFLMEREYKDFIRLLRYFVEVQEPRMEEVHVIVGHDGEFTVVDRHGARVANQYLEDSFITGQEGISQEDLLLSALITIAPHAIMVHGAAHLKNNDILETIENVFEGRVLECSGCELCQRTYEAQFTRKQ